MLGPSEKLSVWRQCGEGSILTQDASSRVQASGSGSGRESLNPSCNLQVGDWTSHSPRRTYSSAPKVTKLTIMGSRSLCESQQVLENAQTTHLDGPDYRCKDSVCVCMCVCFCVYLGTKLQQHMCLGANGEKILPCVTSLNSTLPAAQSPQQPGEEGSTALPWLPRSQGHGTHTTESLETV